MGPRVAFGCLSSITRPSTMICASDRTGGWRFGHSGASRSGQKELSAGTQLLLLSAVPVSTVCGCVGEMAPCSSACASSYLREFDTVGPTGEHSKVRVEEKE